MASKIIDVGDIVKKIRKKQETINKQSRKMKTAPKYVFIGWDNKSGSYPEQGGKPVSYIAKIHEYGLGNHTEKRMVGNTVFMNERKWIGIVNKLSEEYYRKEQFPDFFKIAEKIGEVMKNDLRNYVYAIDLVETERLANSIIVRYRRR